MLLGGICRFLNEPEGRELLDELIFPKRINYFMP